MRLDDHGTPAGHAPGHEQLQHAADVKRSGGTNQKDFTKREAADLAHEYGWTQLSADEVPYYQKSNATHGRLTRWLRVRDPGLNGVVEYITLCWDDEGRWTGLASSESYQRGVSIGTEWVRTITSVVERFCDGMNDDGCGRDAAVLRIVHADG